MSKVVARLLPQCWRLPFCPSAPFAPSNPIGRQTLISATPSSADFPARWRPTRASRARRKSRPSISPSSTRTDLPPASSRLGQPGYVWDGRLLQAPKTFDVFARDVGQVFGIALDDQTPPNIYLAATSLFGLNIVSRGRDGTPERRKRGGPGAGWMKGQFGLELQGGPGSIYKVDGRTGVVSLFANVTLDGVPNPGPGLGNLAYDAAHKQLFVSDLYTGMIHRFALDGRDLGPPYDHGVTGRPTRGNVPAQAFNPTPPAQHRHRAFQLRRPRHLGLRARRRAASGRSPCTRAGFTTRRATARPRTGRRSGRSASNATAASPPIRAGSSTLRPSRDPMRSPTSPSRKRAP